MDRPVNPRWIYIESSNACNLRCHFCTFHGQAALPLGMDNKRGTMPLKRFREVLLRIRDGITCPPESVYITPQWRGEPFIVNDLLERFRLIRQYGFRTGFVSNGQLIRDSMSNELAKVGLDVMAFSLDAATEETYARMRNQTPDSNPCRPSIALAQVERTIYCLINAVGEKNKPYFSVSFVLDRNNRQDIETFADKWLWRNCAVAFQVMGLAHGASRRYAEKIMPPPARIACPMLHASMFVDYRGDVYACCGDYRRTWRPGNVFEVPPLDIFRGSFMTQLRETQQNSDVSRLPELCRSCEVWMEAAGNVTCFQGDHLRAECNALVFSLQRTDFGHGHDMPICDRKIWDNELKIALAPLLRSRI